MNPIRDSRAFSFVLTCVVNILAGCGPHYGFGLYNGTARHLTDVQYPDAPQWVGGGVMGPKIGKLSSGDNPRIPEEGKIVWRTDDNVLHEQVVRIRSAVENPGHFKGNIWFLITDYGVFVAPLKEDHTFKHYDPREKAVQEKVSEYENSHRRAG